MGLLLLIGGEGSGLLDRYSASVAFSLRRLRDSATRAIRVRRSSDSAELDLGFVGNNLDTASLLTFCGAGDGFVTTWYDQVGSNNATQTTAGNQPQIVASGATIVNEFSKPCVRFVDPDTVTIGQQLVFSPFYAASQSYVGFFSVYALLVDGFFPVVLNGNSGDLGFCAMHNSSSRAVRTYTVRSTNQIANGAAISLNTTTVRHDSADKTKVFTYLGTNASATIDIADAVTNFNMPTELWLGNQNAVGPSGQVTISEFIGFTTSQASNQLAIRTNQSNYWRA
jgi:hypothetical protein